MQKLYGYKAWFTSLGTGVGLDFINQQKTSLILFEERFNNIQ